MVFKKQSYQSVYEYPKENTTISPVFNETNRWATYLAQSSPYSSNTTDAYMNNQWDENTEAEDIDFNALDGFTVSSSSRPFHLSQFNTEWSTDTELWPQNEV